MLLKKVTIINKLGLHARASAKFTKLASKFESDVWLERQGRRVNGKSIMGVLMLAAGYGAEIDIVTSGPDESVAIAELIELVLSKFGESD